MDVCTHDALKMYGAEMSVKDIITRVLQDKDYYEKSGGGLTLSGGDPTTQFDFTLEILKQAKEKNINTCLETAGIVSTEKLQHLLPVVDTFFRLVIVYLQ